MSASVLLIFNIVALTIAMTLLAMALSVGVRDLTHQSITLLKNPPFILEPQDERRGG
jgi:hypothetical protein